MINALIEMLGQTIEVLDAESIRYAITGSVASSVHGEPCVSEDVDIILQAPTTKAAAIARRMPPRFYCDEDMLVDAARSLSMANLVDNRTGLKVDLSFVPTHGADQSRLPLFARTRGRTNSGTTRWASFVCGEHGSIGSTCLSMLGSWSLRKT